MIRSSTMIRALVVLLAAYLFSLGATWNGILIPDLRGISLWALLLVTGTWLLIRTLRGWRWHNTPVDLMLPLWFGVFGLSLLANDEAWRRIVIGVWFAGLYALVWVLLLDLLARRVVDRDMLADGLLFAGVIVIGFGYLQLRSLSFDLAALELPRPGSVIGNPNALAGFLVVLFPLAISRFIYIKNRIARWVLAIYALAALLLLFLTFSRGGWLGGGVALVTLLVLALHHAGMLSRSALAGWWRGLSQGQRRVVAGVALMAFVLLLVMVGLLVASLDASGRSVNLRTRIWSEAAQIFAEKPLTGHGLFSFGQELHRYQSMPTLQPHSHAHNIVLNIAAELGLTGLAVLAVTLLLLLRAMRENLRVVNEGNRASVYGGIAACAGFGVHHLLDTPAMMPAIALAGLVVLAIAAAPLEPQPLMLRWRRTGHPIAVIVLALVLFPVGLYATSLYRDYVNALDYVNDDDFRAAAEAMDDVVIDDPHNAIIRQQQGYLWAVVAILEDDAAARNRAINAYSRFTKLEPDNAIGWANLAALAWDAGNHDAGFAAMQRAVELAPRDDQLAEIASISGPLMETSPESIEVDYVFGTNIGHFQFLRYVLPRQFVPQVGYPLSVDDVAAP